MGAKIINIMSSSAEKSQGHIAPCLTFGARTLALGLASLNHPPIKTFEIKGELCEN
jgi:hypothetical protein